MTQQKKKNLDLGQQIQNLTGDIGVEIENKVSSFVDNYIKNIEFSNEDIEQHKHYQLLKSMHEQLQATFDITQENNTKEQKTLQKNINTINSKLIESNKELDNLKQLNTVKLTDSEQVLQEKLGELSALSEQIIKLTASEEETKTALIEAKKDAIQYTQQIKLLEKSADSFAKNDKAKSATLTVQNQQVSALTLQLNNVVSELDYIKAEHNQNLTLTSEHQAQEKQQLIDFQKTVDQLKEKNTKLTDDLKSNNDTQSLEMENTKEKYKVIQNEHVEEVKRLQSAITEHQVTLSNAVKSEKELQEQNTITQHAQEKLTAEKTQLEKSMTQAHHKIASLEESLAENKVFIDESNQKYENDASELHQTIADQQANITQQDEKLIFSAKQLVLLQQKKDDISIAFEETQTLTVNLNKEIELLKEKVSSEQFNASNIQQRVDNNREKQELEYTKARETIKYLRDENNELNTKLEQQVSEMEDKLREYRLRFEYAQKQLNKH